MTRKDYVLIAAALFTARMQVRDFDSTCRVAVLRAFDSAAHELADALAQDNERFDRERFLKAAGVPE